MIEKEETVNARFTILLRIIITLTTITIIPILISDSESQQEQGQLRQCWPRRRLAPVRYALYDRDRDRCYHRSL